MIGNPFVAFVRSSMLIADIDCYFSFIVVPLGNVFVQTFYVTSEVIEQVEVIFIQQGELEFGWLANDEKEVFILVLGKGGYSNGSCG